MRIEAEFSRVPLFSPLALRGLTLRNRIVIAPMCQYSAVDGRASDWHHIHLGQLALSGAGMLVIEATAVEPIGRITPGCLGLYDDACEADLGGVLQSIRRHSPMAIAIQLAHAGRKGSSGAPWDGGQLLSPAEGGWRPIGPSAIPQLDTEPPPHEMSLGDIDRVVQAFADAAARAARLGIDAVELHAAHGYLLHQFLSPLANTRRDAYGGSLDNRMRLPLRVIETVRAAWPAERPLGVRLSATDWIDGGWDLEQSIVFSRAAEAAGADWIDVSSGGVSPRQKIPLGPGYQVPFAEAIRGKIDAAVFAVGLITDPAQANDIVSRRQADAVMLARGVLYDPRWPWHAAAALGASVEAPRQYWRSQPRELPKLFDGLTFGQR